MTKSGKDWKLFFKITCGVKLCQNPHFILNGFWNILNLPQAHLILLMVTVMCMKTNFPIDWLFSFTSFFYH